MNFEDLSPELQEKVKACKDADELAALFQEEGIDLSDEQLEGIAGGTDYRRGCAHKNCRDYATGERTKV